MSSELSARVVAGADTAQTKTKGGLLRLQQGERRRG
jgi:hypothetical protein